MINFAFDTEGFLIQPGQVAPTPVCLQYGTAPGVGQIEHLNPAITKRGWDIVAGAIDSPEVRLIGHNVAYDLASIAVANQDLLPGIWRAYSANRVADTIARQKLIDIAEGLDEESWITVLGERRPVMYDLGTTSDRHMPMALDKSDPWRMKYGTLWNVPVNQWPDEAIRYARQDAIATYFVFQGQEAYARILADEHAQARAAWWIHLMGAWGLRTSRATVMEAEREVQEEIDRDRDTLIREGLVRRDGSKDTKRARDIALCAFRNLGEVPPLTDSGLKALKAKTMDDVEAAEVWEYVAHTPKHISLNDDACTLSGNELLKAYARYGSANTLLSKVRRLYKGCDDTPIQPSFIPLRATGRTSCRQEAKEGGKSEKVPSTWGSQVQNPPTTGKIRECFVPRPGFLYADIDYKGEELCTWAQCCIWIVGYSTLADTINADRDAHTEFAAMLLSWDYQYTVDALLGHHGPERKKTAKNARQVGKISNFGWPGGMGPKRFRIQARTQYEVDMTLEEASRYRDVWRETRPEQAGYFAFMREATRSGAGTIQQFLSNRIRGNIPYTVACNTPFQGLAADAAKAAGYVISNEMYNVPASPLFGSRLVNFVHDQFLAEVPEWNASDATLRMNKIMLDVAQQYTPDVTQRTTPAITRRWIKDAEPVWNDDGTLGIYEVAA